MVIIGRIFMMAIFNDDISRLLVLIFRIGNKLSNFISFISDYLK